MRVTIAARVSLLLIAVVIQGSSPLLARSQAQRLLPPEGQSKLDSLVRESADRLAANARYALGVMHPDGQLAFRRWVLAVTSWTKEGGGAAAALAEGVLFDCLGRTRFRDSGLGRTVYLMTDFTYGREADQRFEKLGQPDRLEYAAKTMERSFKADPSLLEARFRAVRIRALTDAAAQLELERIATSGVDAEMSYLAAVSRAAVAHGQNDANTAIRWYEYALALRGRSTAASIGLSALQPDSALNFDALDPEDPYYSYPCRILTPSVARELMIRLDRLPTK